jgi:thiol-disulfide isomerase/thioredoxin
MNSNFKLNGMVKSKSIFFLVFSLLGLNSNAQEIGDTIPDYTFSDVINAEPFSIAEMRGKKSLIIEFWATWCLPCIPAMDHLEKIQEQFAGQLEIITVSSDDRLRLLNYVEATDCKLRIAYDTSHSSVFLYSSIPHTILVDDQGIIKAITRPNFVTPQIVEELISGRTPTINEDPSIDHTALVDTLYQFEDERKKVVLTTFQSGLSTRTNIFHNENGEVSKYTIDNMGIVSIYRELSNVISSARIVFLDGLSFDDFPYSPENLMCLEVQYYTNEIDAINIEVFTILNSVHTIKARKSRRKIDYYELTQIRSVLTNSTNEFPELTYGGPFFSSQKQPIDKLTYYLENVAETPVIDCTGLLGNYDIELQWQLEVPKTLNLELSKFGLHIEKVKKWKRKKIGVLEIYGEP